MKSTYCSEIDSLGVVLFIGRNGCSYSNRKVQRNITILKVAELEKKLTKNI